MKHLIKPIILITVFLLFCFTVRLASAQVVVTSESKQRKFVFVGYCEEKIITITKTDSIPYAVYDTIRVTYVVPADTAAILQKYCSVIPPIIEPPKKDTLYRGLYLNGFYNIVGNKMYEDALIFDLQRWKVTATHAYSLSDVLKDKPVQLAALHKRIRKETNVTEIMAARGNSSSCTGAATTFNKANSDSSDFDGWNLEYEAYNAYPMATAPFFTFDKTKASSTSSTEASRGLAWAVNKRYLQEMKAGKVNGQVDYSVQYWGWYKTPMNIDAPKAIVELTDYAIVHDYEKVPSFSYTKSRCDDLNKQAVLADKTIVVKPLFSTEPDFMHKWFLFPGNTMDKAFFIWYTGFKAQNYSNLKSDGYIDFALDFRRVAEPSSPSARMINADGSMPLPDFADPDFTNETTERSLLMSKED